MIGLMIILISTNAYIISGIEVKNIYSVKNYFNDASTFFSNPIYYSKCSSMPTFYTRIVLSLPRAKRILNKFSMESTEKDNEKDEVMPPIVMIQNKQIQKEILFVSKLSDGDLGTFGYSIVLCHLMDDAMWLEQFYNKYIDGNNNALLALIDLIYRLGLCFRGTDEEVNCPDDCRIIKKKCENMGNATGYCHSEIKQDLSYYKIGTGKSYSDMKQKFLKWYNRISLRRKLPKRIFLKSLLAGTKSESKKLLKGLINLQYLVIREGVCNCKMYFKYDSFLDTCVDNVDEFICKDTNPCQNGGHCERAMDKINRKKINDIQCKCPPAYKGQFCESSRNPCEELPDVATCNGFLCLRDPNNLKQGFRCRCPQGSYERKSIDDASCIDVNECERQKPCKNGGVCHNVIGSYICKCKLGFYGRECEQMPPDPLWSEWSAWSSCVLPKHPSEICFQMPYRVQTRDCATNVIKQRCIGPSRRLQYQCPDVQLGDILQLCSQATVTDSAYPNGTLKRATEKDLQESLEYPIHDDLGPLEQMRTSNDGNDDEDTLLPQYGDFLYFWLCMLLVAGQFLIVYQWVYAFVGVFGPPELVGDFIKDIEEKQPEFDLFDDYNDDAYLYPEEEYGFTYLGEGSYYSNPPLSSRYNNFSTSIKSGFGKRSVRSVYNRQSGRSKRSY